MFEPLVHFEFWLSFGQLLVAAALMLLTWRLVVATNLMAKATSSPLVTVSIEPSAETNLGFDLVVHNSGSAPAFEVEWRFQPAFVTKSSNGAERTAQPINKHSMIRPGQIVKGYVGQLKQLPLEDFEITVSWKVTPRSAPKSVSYHYSIWSYHGMAEIHPKDPLRKIASEIETLRHRFLQITSSNRLSVNQYDTEDREAERADMDTRLEQFRSDKDT